MAIYRITIVGADPGEGSLSATVERVSSDQSQSDSVEVDGHRVEFAPGGQAAVTQALVR